jgi:flagellar biosynthetic protein FliP
VLASSETPVPFESSRAATSGVMAALRSHPQVTALPGARWVLRKLGTAESRTAESTKAEAGTAEAGTAVPNGGALATAATAVAAGAVGTDAFRAMLGMALSSATKLALVGAVLGALAWTPARASAQAVDSTRTATPNISASPASAAPASASPASAAPASAVRRMAALRGAAAARLGAGRNTQAPAAPGGQTTGGKPLASGTSQGGGAAAAADTMLARLAPQLDLRVAGGKGDGLRLSGTVGVVIMMGLLTLLPTLVLMMTGFTRILIVLQFLKQALGTQNAPPNHLVAALALLLTGFVMGPTLQTVNRDAIQPWLAGKMEQTEMMQVGVKPFREFMLRQTRERDIQTFVEMSHPEVAPKTIDDVPLVVVMSAFVTSELRTAFQLGFALFLPFIIIDIVVSSVLMSMGMMMLPPAMISLPCKLLLFVLVDGWSLIVQSLVTSFK